MYMRRRTTTRRTKHQNMNNHSNKRKPQSSPDATIPWKALKRMRVEEKQEHRPRTPPTHWHQPAGQGTNSGHCTPMNLSTPPTNNNNNHLTKEPTTTVQSMNGYHSVNSILGQLHLERVRRDQQQQQHYCSTTRHQQPIRAPPCETASVWHQSTTTTTTLQKRQKIVKKHLPTDSKLG